MSSISHDKLALYDAFFQERFLSQLIKNMVLYNFFCGFWINSSVLYSYYIMEASRLFLAEIKETEKQLMNFNVAQYWLKKISLQEMIQRLLEKKDYKPNANGKIMTT